MRIMTCILFVLLAAGISLGDEVRLGSVQLLYRNLPHGFSTATAPH